MCNMNRNGSWRRKIRIQRTRKQEKVLKHQGECQEGGSGERHCCDLREQRKHPGGSGKANGELKGNGAHGEGEDEGFLGESGR